MGSISAARQKTTRFSTDSVRNVKDNQHKISKKAAQELIDFVPFWVNRPFQPPNRWEDLPIAGKGTSISCCDGCRPCEINGTEIENLNFRCSASEIVQTQSNEKCKALHGRGKEQTRRSKKNFRGRQRPENNALVAKICQVHVFN